MPSWQPETYVQFEEERTQPCRDLISRISSRDPGKIIDLGCGPGNSTAALVGRWPKASIAGLDSSAEMLARARERNPQCQWIHSDITRWAADEQDQFDIVFSNAALQWVDNHAAVYPSILARVSEGGVLAIQMPANMNEQAHQLMRDLASSGEWRERFQRDGVREWFVHDATFYYDVLAKCTSRIDLWETTYYHVMPDAKAIALWYRGTGLRPFLDTLPDDAMREEFVNDYAKSIGRAYPPRADGWVIFPFRRLFVIATRQIRKP